MAFIVLSSADHLIDSEPKKPRFESTYDPGTRMSMVAISGRTARNICSTHEKLRGATTTDLTEAFAANH